MTMVMPLMIMMMTMMRIEGDDTDDDDGADIDGEVDDSIPSILLKTTNLEKKSQETAALYLRQKYPIRAECRRRKVAP